MRYYLDEGLTSAPHFSSSTTAPAFAVSLDSGSSYLGLGCPAPGLIVHDSEESVTSICSLCTAGLGADVEGDEKYED